MKLWPEADAVLATYTGCYVGLFSAAPSLDGVTVPELAFVGYARRLIALGSPFTHVDDEGRTVRRRETTAALVFGPVLAPAPSPITHVGLFTALTGGLCRRFVALASPYPPPTSGVITIAIGAVALHEA